MIDHRYSRMRDCLGVYFDQGRRGLKLPYSELVSLLINGNWCAEYEFEDCNLPGLAVYNPRQFAYYVFRDAGREHEFVLPKGWLNDTSVQYWVGYVYTAIYALAQGKYTLQELFERIKPEDIEGTYYPAHEASDAKLYRLFLREEP